MDNLPDELILHIGSFLSAKEAAFTNVLSKRWRNLITIVQNLRFDVPSVYRERFKNFADRLSALPDSSRVRMFSLYWCSDPQYYDHINTCLGHVLKRGVLELDLKIKYGYSLPFEVFTCKTVTKLSLGIGFAIGNLPENALLPSLKTLFLNHVKFYAFGGNCVFKSLLDASPVLEELTLSGVNWEHWKWSCTVSSLSLKRLTIIRKEWGYSDFKSISFDTPNLAYLYYSDYLPIESLNVNFSSLVEAKLHLCWKEFVSSWTEEDAKFLHLTNLLHGLKNVEILTLNSVQTLEMFYVFREALPVFEKLSHLSVFSCNACWFPLKVMVEKSPNLKTLTINGILPYRGIINPLCHCVSEYSFLASCPLEFLKITVYYGTPEELTLMESILGKLSCLEHVEVQCPETSESKAKLEFDLQKLPKASSKCKIQVVSV